MSQPQIIAYDDLVAVTASDTTPDPSGPFSGLIVTASGTLKITTCMGSTVTFAGTVVGQEIHVPVKQVWSTGTSATVLGGRGAVVNPFQTLKVA